MPILGLGGFEKRVRDDTETPGAIEALSFSRTRESIFSYSPETKVNMDSRVRGNDKLVCWATSTNSSTGVPFQAKSPGTPRQCLGFTLIEILIVIVILGIATVLATANLFQTDEEALQQEGEKWLAVLQSARDEAAFGGRVIAAKIDVTEVQFFERDFADTARWNASTNTDLATRKIAEGVQMQLRVGASPMPSKDNHIAFFPAGVAEPFEISLRAAAGTRKISGDAIGNLRLTKE